MKALWKQDDTYLATKINKEMDVQLVQLILSSVKE